MPPLNVKVMLPVWVAGNPLVNCTDTCDRAGARPGHRGNDEPWLHPRSPSRSPCRRPVCVTPHRCADVCDENDDTGRDRSERQRPAGPR